MARRCPAIVACLVVLTGLGGGASAQQISSAIAPRDQLNVSVFGEPTLTGKYSVDLDGTFEFPLLGRVPASGLTTRELELELTKRLADGFLKNPQATVEIEGRIIVSQRVFVMGEVRVPGAYPISGEITLLEALSKAGSTTPAAARELLVLRPRTAPSGPTLPEAGANAPRTGTDAQEQQPEIIRVDLRELQTGGLIRNNVTLRDGDTLFVPRAQVVYITGQVRSPGAYTIPQGTTVLQALSLAGGVTDRGSASRIRIMRSGGDSADKTADKTREISVRLTDLVQPGDTIVVPERFF